MSTTTPLSVILADLRKSNASHDIVKQTVQEELSWRSRDKYDNSPTDYSMPGTTLVSIMEGKRAPSLCLSILDKYGPHIIDLSK